MKYFYLVIAGFLLVNCNKQSTNTITNCESIKQGILNNDVDAVNTALGTWLNKTYSEESLNQLATDISSNCDMTAVLQCFDCIKTNPPQSELSVSFVVGDPVRKFVLDLAPATDNTIKVISIN